MPSQPVVFSGIQPSGAPHLGNYLGAIRPWVREQARSRNYFCIVDLHALTVARDPAQLAAQTRELAAVYWASGIDPQHSTVFVQSHVPAHTELGWLLTCLTPMGWLERMTQFKEKSGGQQAERVGAGLFTYPALMAADILLYQTDLVPVGEDQRQHLELARDLAQRFNHHYGDTFVVPNPRIGHLGAGSRVMALDDPTAKMSKTGGNEAGCVLILDPPDLVRRKVLRAQTDSGREVTVATAGPGVANLVDIWRAATDASMEEAARAFDGCGYGQLKARVAEALVEALAPVQARVAELLRDPGELDRRLGAGAQTARPIAAATLGTVCSRLGLLPPRGD
ncbi:MAG TPA: tryptophan--tRNA ligase [Candidatus Micrarchaeia archaeon]|nr:tryptophan--tRNA ligase [Candidatus Micrarchaeia archaeon]